MPPKRHPSSRGPDDAEFADIAVKHHFVTRAQVDDCIAIQKSMRKAGRPASMEDVMLENKLITAHQAKFVHKFMVDKDAPIAGYELLEKIGKGGMGTVFKAMQTSMDRIVAVKVLFPKLADDPKITQRFLQEARMIAKLSHENIIRAIDCDVSSGLYYFAMEYIEGRTCWDIVHTQGHFEENEGLRIGLCVARALEHALKKDIIHRDVKPENIMIGSDGAVKLCDLGLAAIPATHRHGTSMYTVGTPHYISPEQARGATDVDTRTDIYSLGASLYQMITGTLPFSGASEQEIMAAHIHTPLEPPSKRRRGITKDCDGLIARMMAKDRKERYQTPAALIEAIERVLRRAAPPSGTLVRTTARAPRPLRRKTARAGRRGLQTRKKANLIRAKAQFRKQRKAKEAR